MGCAHWGELDGGQVTAQVIEVLKEKLQRQTGILMALDLMDYFPTIA